MKQLALLCSDHIDKAEGIGKEMLPENRTGGFDWKEDFV